MYKRQGRSGDFYYNSGGILLHNLGGTSSAVIEGNTIEYAPAAGIVIGLPEPGTPPFRDVRITNNRLLNPGQNLGFPLQFRPGILVDSPTSNLAITGNTITDTYPTPHCPAAVAFDTDYTNDYTNITLRNNTTQATTGRLPMNLPLGIRQESGG